MKSQECTIILFSGKDKITELAISKLAKETNSGLSDFVSLDCDSNNGSWVDPNVQIHRAGLNRNDRLLDWLAQNKKSLSTVRLVAVVSSAQTTEINTLLDASAQKLSDLFMRMSVNLKILEFRVACPTYSSEPPNDPFFSERANANLIVIARDSASHQAISRPVEDLVEDHYASHIAIEVSTIFGMWNEIVHPISDEISVVNPGVPGILVRFISSRANLLDCPPLPINKVMSQDDELPLPHQFFSVPDQFQGAQKFSDLIYPSELRFSTTEVPSGPLVSVDGKRFMGRYLKELLKALLQMPVALIRGVQDHLNAMSGEALQHAVGGARSSVEILYPGRETIAGDAQISRAQIDRIVATVAERVDRPVLKTIGEETWIQVVEKVLAVVDGGPEAREERASFADDKYLLVRQEYLAPKVDDVNVLLTELFEGKSDASLVATPVAMDSETNGISVEIADKSAGTPTEDPEVADAVVESDAVEEVEQLDVSVSDQVESLEVASVEAPLTVEKVEEKPERSDLLGRITQTMLNEGQAARTRAEQMITALQELPSRFLPSEVSTVSIAVKAAVAAGISILYMAIGGLTGWRNMFNFEFLGGKNRSLAWVLLSTLVIFSAIAGILIRDNKKWQGKVITASTVLVLVLGVEAAFWDSIWKFVMKVERFRGGPIAAALFALFTMVLVAISISRNTSSGEKIRRKFATSLLIFTWAYVVVGTTAAVGSNKSSVTAWSGESKNDVFLISFAVGITLLFVSGLVVAFTIVRERYRLEELSRRLTWAVEELEMSADAERRLRLAAVQWTGTAAVLARLFMYPLGRSVLGEKSLDEGSHTLKGVLKFEHQNLVLTRRGDQGLTARLRQLFIAKGWLGRQYRQLILKFQQDLAFEQGVTLEETRGSRPESCPAVPSFSEILGGKARGARWSFLTNVFRGQYDPALIETTNEIHLESAYSTIVDDPEAHSVGASDLLAPSYFGRLIPTEPMRLPNGLVTSLFHANDSRQILKPYVWWPDELLPKPQVSQNIVFRESIVLTPEKLTDSIRLLGSCVLLSEQFPLGEVGFGEGQFNKEVSPVVDPDSVKKENPRREY